MVAGSPDFSNIDSTNVTVRKKIEGIRIRKKGRIKRRKKNEDIQEEDEEPEIEDEEDEEAQLKRELRERLVAAGLRKDTKTEAEVNAEIKTLLQQKKAGVTLSGALKGHNARKEARKLQEEERIDKLDEDIRKKRELQKQAGKVITKAAQRYRTNKEKKALEKKIKEALEAEIDVLQQEINGIRRPEKEQKTSEKSKRISKAMESIKDFWSSDTTKEAAAEAAKKAKQAKKDAKKEAEDKLTAKAKALQERRKLLEAQGN